MGRVDLHNHLLFELDDGADDAAESLAMARALVEAGFTDVVTTPHSKPDLDPPEVLADSRRAALQAMLDEEGIALRLHPGCENHLTPELLARAARGNARPLGSSRYVLVELPFATPVPNLRDHLFRLMLQGLRPVLAHPERCAQFVDRLDAAREMADAGAHFQIEIGSLAGIYGGPARRTARAMLEAGLVSVAASDVHHLRSAREILGRGLSAMEQELGADEVARLTEENPGRVLRNEELVS